MVVFCTRVTRSDWFQRAVMAVIVLASLLVGVETYAAMRERYAAVFHVFDTAVQAAFTLEIVLRLGAYGRRPWRFFTNGWNIFDFVVTAIFYVPFMGTEVAVLRLARVLRVLRLLTAFPQLQVLVGALVHSIPSMGHIGILLFLLMYVFAVVGNVLFGHSDPEHFGNLGQALLTLFEVITLEGWPDIMRSQEPQALAVAYFVVFIMVGTMIILNLFIGVILNGFDRARGEVGAAGGSEARAAASSETREVAELTAREVAELTVGTGQAPDGAALARELAAIRAELVELRETLDGRGASRGRAPRDGGEIP